MADVFAEAGSRYGISPNLLYGIYGTESDFGRNPSTSSAGAQGPMQFEPSTAASMGVKNVYNLREAVFGAARYLSQYKSRGTAGMLSAYNAGPAGGIQQDYVNKSLQNAKQYKGTASAMGNAAAMTRQTAGQPGETIRIPGVPGYPGSSSKTELNFNSAAYQKARNEALGNKIITGLEGGKELKSILPGAMPKIGNYLTSKTIPGLAPVPGITGETVKTPGTLGAPGTSGRVPPGHELHGLLPAGAKVLEWNRKDQGRDVQLTPGQVLLATGNGYVIRNGSDPAGFGPDYPIVHLTSGPEAGRDVYYGHTDTLVKPGQKLVAGQPVARTSRTGHNAKPGWLEYGFAPGGTPGPFGQETPF